MRVFQDIKEATLEIRRDLSRAPQFVSTRVQQHEAQDIMHEAHNYNYSILPGGIPETPGEMMRFIREHFPAYQALSEQKFFEAFTWLAEEREARFFYPETYLDVTPPDHLHPFLTDLTEGNEFSYVYSDRLIGAVDTMCAALCRNSDSRRAFWPIYTPHDATRSARMTRIPCTLGYYAMIRQVPGRTVPQLFFTYVQRSCDFDRFWASDVFLAHSLQRILAHKLEVDLGNFNHFILSLHSFLEGEIY